MVEGRVPAAEGETAAPPDDINIIAAGLLRDLAFAQATPAKMFGYKRAAAAILSLDVQISDLMSPAGLTTKIAGVGPASTRIIQEILETGGSPTVEAAVDAAGNRADIDRRRGLRQRFLSRAAVRTILAAPIPGGVAAGGDYRGDLQMHSEWSDGAVSVGELAAACADRGYQYAAVTDHSYGLRIAGGMSMAEAADQRRAVDEANRHLTGRFRLLQGIEANIGPDGHLDLSDDEAATFEVVLAAPHSRLRLRDDQTARLLTAIAQPHVHVLAHPRGRMFGSRAGLAADWDVVFAAAAERGVAVEIDGDPARQDLDFTLARRALRAGCLFALDSDAHSPAQLRYADTALAHARLAGIPADRIVNCWPLEQLLGWLARPRASARMRHAAEPGAALGLADPGGEQRETKHDPDHP